MESADYEEGWKSEDQEYAEDIMNRICFAFGAPPPPIRIVEIPPGYAGMYLHNSYGFVAIPKKYLSEGTIAHECGHHLFHAFRPGECHGEGSPGYHECEAVARMVEDWWIHRGRYKW